MDPRHPFVDSAHNGRSEENGNSQLMDMEENQLKREVEMIQRKLIETGVLERSEENGNSQPMDMEENQSEENGNSQPMDMEEIQLKREVEMIQRTLIETGVLERIKDFMIRKLNNTEWRDKMLSACKEFFKDKGNSSKISFDQLYGDMKEKGKTEVDEELKIQALNQMKISYRSSVNN